MFLQIPSTKNAKVLSELLSMLHIDIDPDTLDPVLAGLMNPKRSTKEMIALAESLGKRIPYATVTFPKPDAAGNSVPEYSDKNAVTIFRYREDSPFEVLVRVDIRASRLIKDDTGANVFYPPITIRTEKGTFTEMEVIGFLTAAYQKQLLTMAEFGSMITSVSSYFVTKPTVNALKLVEV